MNTLARTLVTATTAGCALIGIAAVGAAPASATSEPNIQRMINANRTDHDLDMTIVTGDGTTIHEVVRPHSGWYPEADYTGTDVITIRDASGIAYRGEFTFKNGDWVGGHSDSTPRLRFMWHTGPFGGYDFG